MYNSHFCSNIHRHDGAFIIHIIAKNTTELMAADLVAKLWKFWDGRPEEKSDTSTTTTTPTTRVLSLSSTAGENSGGGSVQGSLRKRSYEYKDTDVLDLTDVQFPYSITTA